MDPVHAFVPYFLKKFVGLFFSHLRLCPPNGVFPSGFLDKILYVSPLPLVRAICFTYFILLDLITLIIFGEEYKLWKARNVTMYLKCLDTRIIEAETSSFLLMLIRAVLSREFYTSFTFFHDRSRNSVMECVEFGKVIKLIKMHSESLFDVFPNYWEYKITPIEIRKHARFFRSENMRQSVGHAHLVCKIK
jgi:hypothetical protein